MSSRPDEEIRYAANRDYFRPEVPKLDEVVFRVLPDPGSQVIALEAGEVDWLFAVPGPDRRRVASLPGIAMLESPIGPGGSNCITTVGYNLDVPALSDVERRVQDPGGRSLDRFEQYQRLRAAAPQSDATSPGGALHYTLATAVPDHWIPLVPTRRQPDDPDVRLVRGRVLVHGSEGPVAPTPLGRLLEPGHPLQLFEEEVTRVGAVAAMRRIPAWRPPAVLREKK